MKSYARGWGWKSCKFAVLGVLAIFVAAEAGCSSSSGSGTGGAGGGKTGSGGAAGQAGPGGHGGAAGGAGGGAAGGTGGASGGTAGGGGRGGGGTAGAIPGMGGGGAGGMGGTPAMGTGGGAGVGGAATGGVGGAAGTPGMGGATVTTCGPGTYGGGETVQPLSSITAAVVDETGAPVAAQLAIVCGVNLCTGVFMTDGSGKVTIATQLVLKKPALRLGDGLTYTAIAIPLSMMAIDFSAGGKTLTLGKLSNKPGATLTAGSPAVSSDVALTLAPGTQIAIDTLAYDTADAQKFRSAAIPVAGLAQWLGGVQLGGAPAGFALFYGVAPLGTTFCPPAAVSVALPHATTSPNDLGWAPGTAVELWITTADTGQSYAPYAGWRKMSDGVVSSDGTSVSTLPGQGFSTLENFAIRKAP